MPEFFKIYLGISRAGYGNSICKEIIEYKLTYYDKDCQ